MTDGNRNLIGLLVVFVVCTVLVSWCSKANAAGPSHELQVGQTYEVLWGCNAQGCAVEILTIAHREKSGWVQDTKGYWFHEQNAMAYRVAQKMPEIPHPIAAPATERVER